MDANWHSRYNQMKRRHGLTNDDVAKFTSLTESNVRSQVTRADNDGNGQRTFSPWLKLAMLLDEKWLLSKIDILGTNCNYELRQLNSYLQFTFEAAQR